jgi:hypothetical protein
VPAIAADGLSNSEIATRMFISRDTVKVHLSHVYAKLGVTSRTQLGVRCWPTRTCASWTSTRNPPSSRRTADWLMTHAHTVLSASVGDRRAARIAGMSPAIAPIRIAAAIPPAHASIGMTTAQRLVCE